MSGAPKDAAVKSSKLLGGYIELGPVLGSGGFGKVYFGFDTKKKRKVAVKMIDKELVRNDGIQAYVEREIEMMRKIKSKHVVRLLGAIENSKAYILVMELAANGELFDKIVDSERFDEKTARNFFQQLISAVHYCHNMNIVHRDLKAENLLLGDNNCLKVCDFGLSRYTKDGRFHDKEVLFTSLAGSIDYQAPEVLKERGYEGSACDMWSCGCILFFMLCGYLPFTDRSDGLTRKRILSCMYNKTNKYLSAGASDLIAHLLERDPAKRYTTKDVIRDAWFQVDLDLDLFPEDSDLVSPQSPTTNASGEFIQRAVTPEESSANFGPATGGVSPTSKIEAELREAFRGVNITGDGFLDRAEVRDALVKLNDNKEVPQTEIDDFMKNFILEKDGRISEEQFVLGWIAHQNTLGKKYDVRRMSGMFHYDLEKDLMVELRKAFDAIDVEHTGVITRDNIKKLDLNMSDTEVDQLFEAIGEANASKNKALTFEGFVGLCAKYDLLKNHPLAIRLRRLENIFEITEHTSFKSSLNTGYTVAGSREMIMAHLFAKQESFSTQFENGDIPGFLYGNWVVEGKKVVEVGVRLLPAAQGYTKVVAYRIRGRTKDFHTWFLQLRKAMKDELLRCEEDTAVKGEAELM